MGLFQYIINSTTRKRMAYPFFPMLTGFEDPEGTGVSYDYTQGKVTLTHSSGTVAIWHKGLRYTFASPYTPSLVKDSTVQAMLVLADGGVFTWKAISSYDFKNHAPVAYVYHEAVGGIYICIRECHGFQDWRVHLELHEKVGTYVRSGGEVAGYTIAASSSDTQITPFSQPAVIADEDCPTTVPATVDGSYMRLHFINSVATFTNDSAFPFPHTGNSPQYNPTGTSLATITSNNTYFNVYTVLLPVASDAESQKYRVLWMVGQSTYTSLSAAQAEDVRSLNFGSLSTLSSELIPRAQLTYRFNNSYNTTPRVRVEAQVVYLTGTKSSLVGVSGFVPSVHNNLMNRDAADAHPAASITLAAVGDRPAIDLQTYLEGTYPRFTDFTETVAGSPKSDFALGVAITPGQDIDVWVDGRLQMIEGVNWSRTSGEAGHIITSESIDVGATIKIRLYSLSNYLQGFIDYVETVTGSPKSDFTLVVALTAEHVIDVWVDGRLEMIEGTNWSRTEGTPGHIVLSEAVGIEKVFKAPVYTR